MQSIKKGMNFFVGDIYANLHRICKNSKVIAFLRYSFKYEGKALNKYSVPPHPGLP